MWGTLNVKILALDTAQGDRVTRVSIRYEGTETEQEGEERRYIKALASNLE